MASLQIFIHDTEHTHDLIEDIVTIGRMRDNTIQIEDPSVSSHHAKITSLDGKFEIYDLNSTNGTRINGVTSTEGVLENGTKIRFGSVEAVFKSELPGSAVPLPEAGAIGAKVAEDTERPTEFINASPFGKRSGKKDLTGKAIFAFAILAALGGLAAIGVALLTIKAPL